jgi:capsular polysaccharide biosynthesis protein
MSDRQTDIRSVIATLRRRRRLLVAAAAVGLAAGLAYVILEPPPLTSTTLVLLPTPARVESSSSDIDTQVRIALSATTLERAGKAVRPALSARAVEKKVEVTAATNQLLQIKATSTKAAEAQTLSQAVADSYVGYVSDTAREVTDVALADLNVRRDELQQQIQKLQNVITAGKRRQRTVDPNSPEGGDEARLLAELQSEQADLSVQLDKVKDAIATGAPVGSTATAGTSVIQRATEARGLSTLVRLFVWPPCGAAAFTILAAVALLAVEKRDTRMRLRDEIGDAVGSPVLAGVRSRPQQSVAGWLTLLETYQATPVEEWAFRRILHGLLPTDRRADSRSPGKVDHPKSLSVVSLSDDGRGLAIGPQLAAFASSLGITTRLVTAESHEWAAAALWAACAVEHEAPLRPGLYVGNVPAAEAIDMTITLVVVDRRRPRLGGATASAATILSVASATATEQELARVAVAVDDTGHRIDGIVVADPDQSDRTSGRHTMDERSRQLTLPTRLTRIASSDGTVRARNRSRS